MTPILLTPGEAVGRLLPLLDAGASVPLRVTGNSMVPFLRDRRDLVSLRAPRFLPYQPGDILLFRPGGRPVGPPPAPQGPRGRDSAPQRRWSDLAGNSVPGAGPGRGGAHPPGRRAAIFTPAHGSAPSSAAVGRADPLPPPSAAPVGQVKPSPLLRLV